MEVLNWAALCRLKVDDEAGGNAGAIGVRAEGVEADVVQLGAEGQVGEQADVHAAADAIGKLVGRGAARAVCEAGAAEEGLHKRIDFGGVAKSQTRAEEIGVGVQGNAAGRGVVTAEIAGDAEPAVEIVGDRAADAVLVETARISQAEVGVADGGINGLGAGGDGENGHRQEQEDELFHRIRSFRGFESEPLRTEGEGDGPGRPFARLF